MKKNLLSSMTIILGLTGMFIPSTIDAGRIIEMKEQNMRSIKYYINKIREYFSDAEKIYLLTLQESGDSSTAQMALYDATSSAQKDLEILIQEKRGKYDEVLFIEPNLLPLLKEAATAAKLNTLDGIKQAIQLLSAAKELLSSDLKKYDEMDRIYRKAVEEKMKRLEREKAERLARENTSGNENN